jgi:hypothetical protein
MALPFKTLFTGVSGDIAVAIDNRSLTSLALKITGDQPTKCLVGREPILK